jgi:hypothetical protein
MGDVLVKKATLADGRIAKMQVGLYGLPDRTIDRDTALAWMKDGHSFIPVVGGQRQAALQLVEVGDEDEVFVRQDNAKTAQDALPELPSA